MDEAKAKKSRQQKNWWKSLTEKQREHYRARARQRYANLSDDEREAMRIYQRNYHANLSEEKKQQYRLNAELAKLRKGE